MIVSQDVFDRLSAAVMACDAEAFTSLFKMPAFLISPAGNQVLKNKAAACLLFDDFRAGVDHQAADSLIMVSREVNYLTPEMMTCTFDVHLMHRAERRAPSFSANATLCGAAEEWRIASLTLTEDLRLWAGRRSTTMAAFARPRSSMRVA